MPQKINPVASETIVGLGFGASAAASVLLSAMLGGHERSAGEWQAEWDSVPYVFGYVGGALAQTLDLVSGLEVDATGIAANLDVEHGLLMAEALMMHLASELGRDRAHELVYDICSRARTANDTLIHVAQTVLAEERIDLVVPDSVFDPSSYIGESREIVARARATWVEATS